MKKSVTIAGRHTTSISLEPEFWLELVSIAKEQNISVNQLVTNIDKEKTLDNLSAAIRVYILKNLKSTSVH